MADQVINQLTELNQKELGDNKLSRQEIQYLQSKEKLWAKDVSGGLFNDVIAVNKKSFETPKVKVLVDYLTTHFKSIPQFQKILKNLKWDKTSEFNKQCMALNMLLALSSSPADGETKKALLNSSNIASFSSNTIKALHAYQKKYEKTAGWSKADCIVGPKTIQQLIMDVGISTSDMISGVNLDSSYSSSKKEIQNSYQYALNSRKAIDAIMKDNTLGPVEKTKAMIEVYKKTSPDKKYSSATYMILHIKKLLAAIPSDFSDIKKQLLASFDKKLQLELKQYWNAANSKDDLGIKKTDDFFTEFENVEKSKMAWDRQFNLIMAVANGWKSYYLSNKKKAEKDLPELKQVDIALLSLQKYRNFDGIDHSKAIASLLKKIMIPSSENKNQKDAIDNIIKELEFGIAKLGNGIPPSDYYMREVAFVTTQMRSIDKGFDLTKGIFSVNNYESGDAIVDIISVSSETSPRKIKLKDSGEDARSYNADMAKLNDIFDNPANGKLDKIIQALDKTVKGSTTVGGTIYGGLGTTIETRSYDAEAINYALKYVGLENIPEKSKKELWKKYNEAKADIAKNARESANSTISSVIQSIEEGRDFAQKQGNLDLVQALNTQLMNWEGFKSGRGSLYIDDKNALLKEMFTSLGITDTTNITRDVFVQKITALSMNMSLSYMIEKVLTVGVLEKHSTLIDNLAVGSASSKNLKLYSNIFGVGKARSDKTTNTVINVSKEVLVMVIVTVATMGAGSILSAVGSGVLLGARAAATGARIVKGVSTLERLGVATSRYKTIAQTALKLAESANKIKTVGIIGKTAREAVKAGTAVKEYYSVGKAAFGAGKMIVEGSAFHFGSTAMSNALNGNAWDEGLHDWKGYARTALFLGAFKYVNGFLGKAFDLQTSKGISEALAKTISLSGKTWVISKSLLQGMGSVGIEFAAMQAVDIPLSLMFDGDLPDFSVESLAQTLGFIIGMRSYHGLLKVTGLVSDAKGVSEVTIERPVNGIKEKVTITRDMLKNRANEAIKNKKENHNEFRGKVEAKLPQQENVKTIREIKIEINKLGEEKGRIDKRLEELEKEKIKTDEVVTETNKLTKELKEVELKQKDLIEQKKQIEINPAMLKVDRIKTEILNYKEQLLRNERVTEGEVLITDKISELEAQLLQVESTMPTMPSKFKKRATKLIDFVNRGRNVNTQEVEEVIKELDKAEVDVNAEANTEVKQSKLNWLGKVKNWLNEFRGKVEAKQENVKTIREIKIEINKLGEEKRGIERRLEELGKEKIRTDEVVTETNKLTKELKEVELKQKDLIEQKKQIEINPAMLKVDRIKTEILNYKEQLLRNERVTEGEVLITDKISELEAQLLQVESTMPTMPSKFKKRATKLIDFVNRGRNVNTQEVEAIKKEVDNEVKDVKGEPESVVKQSKLNWLGKVKNWLNEFRGKVEAKQENVKTSKEEIAKKQKKIEVLEQMLEADRAASDGTFETLQTLEAANKDIIKEKAELMEMEANMPTMPSKFKKRATKLIDFVNRGRNVNTQEVEEVIKELDKAEVDVNAEANTEVKQSKLNWLGKAKKWLNEFRGKVEAKQEAKSKNIDIKNNQQQKEVLEKSIETDFQSKILGKGIVIGGVTYRIELLQTTSQNKNHNPYKLAIYEKTSAGEKLVTTETFKENPVENGKINIKKGYKESFQSRLRDLENSYLAERVATEIGKVPAFKSSESVLLKIRDLFVLGKAKISEINDAIKDFNGVIAFLGKKMIGEVEMELEIIREGLTMKKNEIIKTQQSQKVKNLETVELSSNLALVQKAENLVELYESVDARIGNLNAQKKLLQNQIDETKKQEELNYKLTNLNQQKEFYASQIKQINETGRVVVENYVAGGITQERVVLEEDIINKLTLVEEKIESTRNDLDNLGTITNSKQDLENNIMKIDKQIESFNSSKEEIKQNLLDIPGWNEIFSTLSTPSSNSGALKTYMTPRQKFEIFKTNSETGNNQMGSNKDVNANAEEANSNNASDETPSNEVKLNPATTGQIETISYGSAKEVG